MMTISELHSKIVAAKQFLNSEMVKLRTTGETVSTFGVRELGDRLDMIHEVERRGMEFVTSMTAKSAVFPVS